MFDYNALRSIYRKYTALVPRKTKAFFLMIWFKDVAATIRSCKQIKIPYPCGPNTMNYICLDSGGLSVGILACKSRDFVAGILVIHNGAVSGFGERREIFYFFDNLIVGGRGGFGSGGLDIGQIRCPSVENKLTDYPSANRPLIGSDGRVG